jgi:capsular exopolysaccharide synthesis family protein
MGDEALERALVTAARHILAARGGEAGLGAHSLPPSASPPPAEEQSHRLSWTALKRAKWLIVGLALFLSAVIVPPIWLLVVPKYAAQASIRVAPVVEKLIYETPEASAPSRFFPQYVATLIADLKNAAVLQRVLDRPEVQKTTWYGEQARTVKTLLGGEAPSRTSRLRDSLEVENIRNTELITVQVLTTTAADAHVIANAIVEEYLHFDAEMSAQSEGLKFQTLRDEKKKLEARIGTLLDQVGEISKKLGTDDPDIVRSQLATQLGELDMKRKALKLDYQMTIWALEKQRSERGDAQNKAAAANGGAPVANADAPKFRYAQDPTWVQLNTALETAKHELFLAKDKYGPAHPKMKELASSVDHNNRLLEQREAQLGPAWEGDKEKAPMTGDGKVAILFADERTLERLGEKNKRELELLDEQIAALQDEQAGKGELAKQVRGLADQERRERDEYERVLARLRALEMEQKAPGRISVASWAIEPTEPARDKRGLYTLAALAGSLLAAVVVAHVKTSFDPRVSESADVRSNFRVPFLGQLPAIPGERDIVLSNNPLVAECMRIIRTALLDRLNGSGRHVVLITSATSAAGKTTVAIQLSRSLAQLGRRTLLVEADLRRPTMLKRLGITAPRGLAALLAGQAEPDDVILATDDPKLDLLPAGNRPMDFNPELLADGHFTACLARWRKSYEFVVIDSPPMLPVADARILAHHVDGAIMVSRASHCKRADVVQACTDLAAAGSPLLGTVLVGSRSGPGYSYSYSYTADEQSS